MSIVEKALSKLQASGAKPSAERRPSPESLPTIARPSGDDDQPTFGALVGGRDAPTKELVARHQITIDPAALQEAGILPPQASAMAVRNQFRRLKWPVLDEIIARRREAQVNAGAVMIASAVPDEGKTFVSANLALSMAREEDRRVVLMDADIAKGHLSEAFGLRERPGITEFLAQPALTLTDVLVATSIDRLFIIPAGRYVQHASDLLSSARMQQLLQELTGSGSGTTVLIDTSPVMVTNEAQVLSRLVPQVILVVRAERTPQATVIEAVNILGRDKTSVVLNQAALWLESGTYTAGYGYYANEER